MPRIRTDQAEGLRRMLARSRLRVVSVSDSATADGRLSAIVNLAGALAELGSDPLIVDEHPPANGIVAALGLTPRYDLQDVIRGRREIDDLIVRGPAGIRILPLARGAGGVLRLPAADRQSFIERCRRPGFPVDTVLMSAVHDGEGARLWQASSAQDVVVLSGGGVAAITAAYASIKRLSTEFARREFHILVSNVASEREAKVIFGNMASVARRYLRVSLHLMGHVPPDVKLQLAARLRLPVGAAFPAAASAENFRSLAQSIIGWPQAVECDGGLDGFFRRLVHPGHLHATAIETSH